MAETEVKSINGRTLADVTARARIEEIKNAAPGLVFDTVADMEAYIAENADTLKVGQDLFIREADVPDYWWDGTAAVPVETELGEVKEQLNELSEAISEQGKEIPKVFPWAIAELPFDENTVSDYVVNTTGQNPGGFVTNPVGFEDGKPYFQYHAGAKSFTWTNPNPQKGAVTITAKGIDQYYSNSGSARLRTYYDDGTEGDSLYIVVNHESRTVTWTSDPEKTLAKITGNYDLEGYVLLDMDVMSIVADYPAPTGTVKSVNGNLPDENGNVEIDIPESGGSGGTDIALGISGATVGQIARITAVDDTGMPTAWEAVDENTTPKLLGEVEFTEDVTNPEIALVKRAKKWVLMYIHNKSEESMIENYPRINGNFVDMYISVIGGKKKQWVMVELLGGGYTKWTWSSSAGGVWDGTTQSVYAKAALYQKVNYDTYGIESIGRNGLFVAGSKIMVWGE